MHYIVYNIKVYCTLDSVLYTLLPNSVIIVYNTLSRQVTDAIYALIYLRLGIEDHIRAQ